MDQEEFDITPTSAAADNASPKAGKKKKKGSIWLKILIVILSLILAALLAVAFAMNYILGLLGRFDDPQHQPGDNTPVTDEFDTDSTIEGQETLETVDASDVVFETVDSLEGDVVNIMLIGQDRRPGESRARSDSMILVTLNRDKNAIQLTSFMRDTYVQIPGYMDNRLNAPYSYGGTDLMNETFKVNFGLNIDGNVMVDFNMFTEVIDLVGGVYIDITETEAQYMRNHGYPDSFAGVNFMEGKRALEFCRMRYVAGGDYGRTERQRRTLIAVANSVRDADLLTVLNLVNQVLPNVVTNINDADVIAYVTEGLMMLANGAEIQTLRIPQDDAHYNASIRGMSVLVPDLEMCREDLAEFIYSK